MGQLTPTPFRPYSIPNKQCGNREIKIFFKVGKYFLAKENVKKRQNPAI